MIQGLKISGPVWKPHWVSRTIKEDVLYPGHAPRKETKEYRAVRYKLVYDMDLPCLVCGVKQSTLKNKKENRFGAKMMQTHHRMIEYAFAEGVDIDKFNKTIVPTLASHHPKDLQYKKPFTHEKMLKWVDHSPHNLWVLCDVHHIGKNTGIHELTYPIWSAQDLLLPDFQAKINIKVKENYHGHKH